VESPADGGEHPVGSELKGEVVIVRLLAALESCTSMTVAMYARRKRWPLEAVTVRLRRAQLVEIANRCPIHRTLTSAIDIRTHLL
jgi:putative redox protein